MPLFCTMPKTSLEICWGSWMAPSVWGCALKMLYYCSVLLLAPPLQTPNCRLCLDRGTHDKQNSVCYPSRMLSPTHSGVFRPLTMEEEPEELLGFPGHLAKRFHTGELKLTLCAQTPRKSLCLL